MKKLKKWDPVVMIAWNNKWTVSVISHIDGDKVYVEGINMKKRAKKGQWYIDKHLSVHISNVSYAVDGKPSKINIVVVDGKKKRKVALNEKIVN